MAKETQWFEERGGAGKLNDEQKEAAQTAHESWKEEREEAGQKVHNFENYVKYVQNQNEKKSSKSESKAESKTAEKPEAKEETKESPKPLDDLKNYGEGEKPEADTNSSDFNQALFGAENMNPEIGSILSKIDSDLSVAKGDIGKVENQASLKIIQGRAIQTTAKAEQKNPENMTRMEAARFEVFGKVEEKSGQIQLKEADFMKSGVANPERDLKVAAMKDSNVVSLDKFRDIKDNTKMMTERLDSFVEKGFATKESDGSYKLTNAEGLKGYLTTKQSDVERSNVAYNTTKSDHTLTNVSLKSISKAIESKDLNVKGMVDSFYKGVNNFERASGFDRGPGANVVNFTMNVATVAGVTGAVALAKITNSVLKNVNEAIKNYSLKNEREKIGANAETFKKFEEKEAKAGANGAKDVSMKPGTKEEKEAVDNLNKEIEKMKEEAPKNATEAKDKVADAKSENDKLSEKTAEKEVSLDKEKEEMGKSNPQSLERVEKADESMKSEIKDAETEAKAEVAQRNEVNSEAKSEEFKDKLAEYRVERTNDNSDKASNNPEPEYSRDSKDSEKEPKDDSKEEVKAESKEPESSYKSDDKSDEQSQSQENDNEKEQEDERGR